LIGEERGALETFRPVKVFLEWICSESSSCFISFVPSLSEVLSWDTCRKVGFAQHVIAQLVQCVGLLREVFKIGVGRDAKSFKHLQNGAFRGTFDVLRRGSPSGEAHGARKTSAETGSKYRARSFRQLAE